MYDFASMGGGLGIGVEAADVAPAKARDDRNVKDRTVNVRRIRGTPRNDNDLVWLSDEPAILAERAQSIARRTSGIPSLASCAASRSKSAVFFTGPARTRNRRALPVRGSCTNA